MEEKKTAKNIPSETDLYVFVFPSILTQLFTKLS